MLEAAEAHEEEDAFVLEMVGQGESVDGLFPMNAAWRERFGQWRATRRT